MRAVAGAGPAKRQVLQGERGVAELPKADLLTFWFPVLVHFKSWPQKVNLSRSFGQVRWWLEGYEGRQTLEGAMIGDDETQDAGP